MSMENQFKHFRQKFIDDSMTLLDQLESDIIQLEKNFHDSELIQSVFRCMHTLKGVAGMYGFDNISNLTHQIENLYDLIRENRMKITQKIIQLTLSSSDFIRKLLQGTGKNTDDDQIVFDKIVASVNQIIDSAGIQPLKIFEKNIKVNSNSLGTWQIIFKPDENLFERNINIVNTFRDLFELGSYNIIQNTGFAEKDTFTIFLFTDNSLEDIENALFFILEYCKIIKIAEFDIFNETELEKQSSESNKKYNFVIESDDAPDSNQKLDDLGIDIMQDSKISPKLSNRILVDSSKLDELMYLVSELITTNSQLILTSKDKIYNPIRPIFEKIDKLSKQFRNNTLNLRLVPINEMVLKFQRLVRDLSQQMGKDIELITQGTETELDKSTIDALSDPIMHLIRNCIDHGIESPEIRKSRNKSAVGVIKITAYHSGNFVFIQVQDDGQGIDVDKIKQKAIDKNIITRDANLSEKELFNLIFIPGFSTAESLTQISGRGVGMDVVKRKISELRGQIEISSERGLGTSFTIKLHQTIAILDTMLFRLGDTFFMVPLSDIEKCSLIDNNELEKRKLTSTIPYNNKLIPYIDLYSVFNLTKSSARKLKLLIINRQDCLFAVAADVLIGEHQAVLKSIGNLAKRQPYIAVASVLGDGNLAYLIDLTTLQQNFMVRKIAS